MSLPKKQNPAPSLGDGNRAKETGNKIERCYRPYPNLLQGRDARHLAQVAHINASGPRVILEALCASFAAGATGRTSLDDVLEDFARIPVEIYRALGADRLPLTKRGATWIH